MFPYRVIIGTAIRSLVLCLILGSLPLFGTSFSFRGNFTVDDGLQFFSLTLNSPATVEFVTLSYGGGVNSAGISVPRGGFDPILSLYSGSGPSSLLVETNNDGTCPPSTQDTVTNACWDSNFSAALTPGTYTLVLSQSDNGPVGSMLSDGFLHENEGNYTGPLYTGAPGSFFDANPNQRDSYWAVDILNVDSASIGPGVNSSGAADVPEPGAAWIFPALMTAFLFCKTLQPNR